MAQTKENWTVGEAVRKSSLQRMSDAAGTADDRALEILATPGSTLKKILPLSEESATLNPRILVAGKDTDATIANGVVRVRPAHFIAGASANAIGLSAKLAANLDSPAFGNNSSGATRYDLLYASISYGTATAESVRQKPLSGGDPISVNINTQLAPLVTLNVVAGVASGNPLASLPADAGGVYNFGLAMVALANAFAGGAINQASITPLWGSGYVSRHRLRGIRLMSLYYGSASEKPSSTLTTQISGAERWGAEQVFFGHLKLLSSTPDVANNAGTIIDNTIDWRHRMLWVDMAYLGSAGNLPLDTEANPITGTPIASPATAVRVGYFSAGGGFASGSIPQLAYVASGGAILQVDTSGNLRVCRNTGHAAPIDATNGDIIAVRIQVSDQMLSTPY